MKGLPRVPRSREVAPCGRVFTVPGVGRFLRVRVYENDRDQAVRSARFAVSVDGERVADIVSAVRQPFDIAAIGRGEPTGGYVVEVRLDEPRPPMGKAF